MNNDEFNERERLLSDVLGGESFESFNAGAKSRAMVEFRRARLIRRTVATVGTLAVFGLAAVVGLMTYQWPARQAGLAK